MSYIINSTNPFVSIKLTEKGREQLAQGQLNFSFWGIGDSEIKIWVKLRLFVCCNHVMKGKIVVVATEMNVWIGIYFFVPPPEEKEVSFFLWFRKCFFRKKGIWFWFALRKQTTHQQSNSNKEGSKLLHPTKLIENLQ